MRRVNYFAIHLLLMKWRDTELRCSPSHSRKRRSWASSRGSAIPEGRREDLGGGGGSAREHMPRVHKCLRAIPNTAKAKIKTKQIKATQDERGVQGRELVSKSSIFRNKNDQKWPQRLLLETSQHSRFLFYFGRCFLTGTKIIFF